MTSTPRRWLAALILLLAGALGGPAAHALDLGGLAKKAGGGAAGAAGDKVIKDVNARLLAEGRKDQCTFKTDSDVLLPGCDKKLKRLANTLVEVKKKLDLAGMSNFKFEVSGHTDSSGKPDFNRELSERRAANIAREMVARGISPREIIAVGLAAQRPLVTPDDTPAKKAKNRRYEIQVRL